MKDCGSSQSGVHVLIFFQIYGTPTKTKCLKYSRVQMEHKRLHTTITVQQLLKQVEHTGAIPVITNLLGALGLGGRSTRKKKTGWF